MSIQTALESIKEHGPYITTENFEESGDNRGRVHFKNPRKRSDSPLVFVDLRVSNVAGTVIELHRVEVGKIINMAREAQERAEVREDTL